MTYRVLDMFAGIGGFSLGLHRTGGFETVSTVEINPYAGKVLDKRIGAPNLGDVTTAEFPDADFICAGFPCQDISFAGAGAGITGARSGLYGHVVRALRMVRPRGALLENVAALLGRGLDRVLGDMAEIGYDAEWHCIPASAVGAPHRRDRIWIVANPGGEQHEGCRAPISGQIAAELLSATANTSTMFRAAVERSEPDGDHAGAGEVANADCAGLEGRDGEELSERAGERVAGQSGSQMADASRELLDGRGFGSKQAGWREPSDGCWWSAEPDVGRVAHGVPSRVDRLRCLGNAVVPQIPELIGRAILASEAA